MPRQGASPGVSLQDCSYKTPRWGSKDRGLFTRSPEAGSPESWGGQGRAPSGGVKGGSLLLLQPLGPPASLPSLLPWSHVLLPWVSPLPAETPVTGAGPTPVHYDLIFINRLCKDLISK